MTPETQAHPPGPSRTPRGAGPARVCSASLSCATRSQCPPVQRGSRAPASHQTHEDARTAPSRGALRPTHWRPGRRAARAVYGALARCGHAHQAAGRCADWPVRQPVNAHGQHGGARGGSASGEAALSCGCAAVQRPSMRLWRSTAILSGVGGPSARWLDFGRCAGGAPVSLPFCQARGQCVPVGAVLSNRAAGYDLPLTIRAFGPILSTAERKHGQRTLTKGAVT